MHVEAKIPSALAPTREDLLFEQHRERILKRTDRLFAGLLAVEWLAGIVAAYWISPRAWSGASSEVHPHVWAAVFLGGLISAFPIYLALTRPGSPLTRHVIAIAQMLVSALLIHLTGGRIETHFHVFGSLAFLAFYRDWKVLISASAVVAADHFLRGVYWPQSVFGVLAASGWRWLEHAGWVVFEDVFLITACLQGIKEMTEIARRQASVEALHESVEEKVLERTSALRASEDALRESSEQYRQLVELSPEAIFIQTEGNFVFVNSALVKLLGANTPDDLLGTRVADRIHPAFHGIVNDRMRLLREERKTVPLLEEKWIRLDGAQVDVEVAASPFTHHGKDGAQVVVLDVTQRKSLETQLRQSQKMEAVGRLAGGVAHDFNNLLTVITAYSDLTLDRLPAEDPLRRNVDEIGKSANRAAALTRQLLAFSRQQVLQPRVLDLNAVVAEMEKMLGRLIGEDVRLSTVLDPKLRHVKADPGQIEQVIMNLAVNARDAMTGGGNLTIETRNIEMDDAYVRQHPGFQPGTYVQLVVSDSGCGMDETTRARIFEPFFTTKELGKGTGLGLSTVYGIVKQSGGYIAVYSEPGHGTTFNIYLPHVNQALQATESVSDDRPPEAGAETILLVEDEDVVRRVSREILQGKGYTVLEANCGLEALRLSEAHEGPIHLVMSDLVMPGMSGRETVAELVRRRPDIRVLFVSGYTQEAVMQRQILDPSTVFLQKPFSAAGLAESVRETLRRKLVEKA